LSSTSSSCRPARERRRVAAGGSDSCGYAARASAIAVASSPGRVTGASATNAVPSAKPDVKLRAASTASRVLPTPPGPIRVTSRACATSSARRCTSASRPNSEVVGMGSAAGAAGASSAASCSSTARCTARSRGPGSMPSCSTNTARAAW
jgi:hypothetical protein